MWHTRAVARGYRLPVQPWRLLAATVMAVGVVLVIARGWYGGDAPPPMSQQGAAARGVNMHAVPAGVLTGVTCAQCHWSAEPAPGRAGLLTTTRPACLQCHPQQQAQLAGSSLHAPFKSGECTSCHQAHRAGGQTETRPALLTAPAEDLCLTCHANQRQQQTLSYSHPPFANGQCLSCHDPHAGAAAPTLRAAQDELCFTCHQSTAKSFDLPVQHPPFVLGNCGSCHTAHASEQPAQFRAPIPEVCYSCHASMFAHQQPAHTPVRAGLCNGCHQAHGGRFPKLFPAPRDGLCLRCHSGLRGAPASPVPVPAGTRPPG